MDYRKIILDASALIALIDQEKGWEAVQENLSNAVMSVVNVSEVAKFLIDRRDYSLEAARTMIEHLISATFPFDDEQCYIAARLYKETKSLGLSLGDRACMALAINTGYPIYTADRIWKKVQFREAQIIVIR